MNQNQTGDFPTITASTYASSSANPAIFTLTGGATNPWQGAETDAFHRIGHPIVQEIIAQRKAQETTQPNPPMATTKRIVRVYLADVDDNIPLDKSVLYSGSEKLTDSTDQELYFEIPVQDILTKHNAYRATVTDKKATNRIGKEVLLEPVKIRDLKMIVVNIATF